MAVTRLTAAGVVTRTAPRPPSTLTGAWVRRWSVSSPAAAANSSTGRMADLLRGTVNALRLARRSERTSGGSFHRLSLVLEVVITKSRCLDGLVSLLVLPWRVPRRGDCVAISFAGMPRDWRSRAPARLAVILVLTANACGTPSSPVVATRDGAPESASGPSIKKDGGARSESGSSDASIEKDGGARSESGSSDATKQRVADAGPDSTTGPPARDGSASSDSGSSDAAPTSCDVGDAGCLPGLVCDCPAGSACDASSLGTCLSSSCVNGRCAPVACSPMCGVNATCSVAADCLSGVCTRFQCQPSGTPPGCTQTAEVVDSGVQMLCAYGWYAFSITENTQQQCTAVCCPVKGDGGADAGACPPWSSSG